MTATRTYVDAADIFGPIYRYDPQRCPNRAHHPEGSLCLLCCPCPECEHERGW